MDTATRERWGRCACGLSVLLLFAIPAEAGVYVEDFEDGTADNASLFGDASVDNNNLLLTPDLPDQLGSMVIDDLDPGMAVEGFSATFDILIGPSEFFQGDGASFNFGNLPEAAFGEDGPGDGLTVSFDTFDNGGADVGPAITILVDGAIVADQAMELFTADQFVSVSVSLDAAGHLDVTFDGAAVFTDLAIGFVPAAGDVFGFGGRTGSATNEHRIDDIDISTTVEGDGAVIPEPCSIALLGLACAGLLKRRSQRSRP